MFKNQQSVSVTNASQLSQASPGSPETWITAAEASTLLHRSFSVVPHPASYRKRFPMTYHSLMTVSRIMSSGSKLFHIRHSFNTCGRIFQQNNTVPLILLHHTASSEKRGFPSLNGRFVCEAFPAYKVALLDEDQAFLQPHLDGQEQHKAELSRAIARINHSASAILPSEASASALSEKSQLRNQ